MSNVKVAVRCRPFNKRENSMGTECVLKMVGTQTLLMDLKSKHERTFNFDHSFWTFNKKDPDFADQEKVFEALGPEIMENVFEGFNACVFAYGQTGSGKTYTMMGTHQEPGVIPRICTGLYDRINANQDPNTSFKVEVSYMEIYNEKVADLLAIGGNSKKELKVREHKVMGPYVEGLARLAVANYSAIETLMNEGNKLRHVAKTKMNDTSSRSHAVFTLFFTQAMYDPASKQTGERVSRINLVDLAGSERNKKTGTSGAALKEGANINKSLTTLGLVISALAERSKNAGKGKKDQKGDHIPFRDSTLTWLLKDNLGGNAKTVMIATISPAADNYDETLSTLRYADRAKAIVNHAVVNEDPNQRLIRELREELERLRNSVGGEGGGGGADPAAIAAMKAQMAETEALMASMSQSWEEKLAASQKHLEEHRKMLDMHGAAVSGDQGALKLQSRLPHLVSIGDEFAVDIAIYTLHEGLTRIGSYNGDPETLRPPEPDDDDYEVPEKQDIILKGKWIDEEQCLITFKVEMNEDTKELREVVTLFPIADQCYVNGVQVSDDTDGVQLHHANVVQFGKGKKHIFRFNHPVEAQRLREQRGDVDDDEDDDEDGTLSPSASGAGMALPGGMLKRMQEELAAQNQQELAEERARMEAQIREDKEAVERERQEREELMRREAAVHEATIAAKQAEAERKMKELQAMMAEAAAAKESAEAERHRVALRERELAAQKQAETDAMLAQLREEKRRMEEESERLRLRAKEEAQELVAQHAAQQNQAAEAAKEVESNEMRSMMAQKMAEMEAKLAEEKARMDAAKRKQESEYNKKLEDMARKQAELERSRAADEAAASAAIGEDEAEEKRALQAAKAEAQKNKMAQQALSGGAAGAAATAFNDPHYAKLGLGANVDLFAKPVPTSTGAPVRRGSNVKPFTSPTNSNMGGLPPKIAATAFAGNPFATKIADNPFGAPAASNPFATPGMGSSNAPNPFGAPVTAGGTPFGSYSGSSTPMAPAQAAAAAGSFFSSLQPSAQGATTPGSDPFSSPPELPAHSPLVSPQVSASASGADDEEEDGFNPDAWKPSKGSTLKANAGGYITYTVGGDEESDDDDDDDDSEEEEEEELESSKLQTISESPQNQRDRIIAEKAREIMMLQESLQADKQRFAEVQERQRTESKGKKGLFERFRHQKKGSTQTM